MSQEKNLTLSKQGSVLSFGKRLKPKTAPLTKGEVKMAFALMLVCVKEHRNVEKKKGVTFARCLHPVHVTIVIIHKGLVV